MLAVTLLTACGGSSNSGDSNSNSFAITEHRSIGKTASNTPRYQFTERGGEIHYGGACQGSRDNGKSHTATPGLNATALHKLREGVYNDCTLQIESSDGDFSDVLHITSFEVDIANKTIQKTDSNNDGVVDSISTTTYDAFGNQLTYNYDNNGDGTANSINAYTYDAQGNRLTYHHDSDGDGTANYIRRYRIPINSEHSAGKA